MDANIDANADMDTGMDMDTDMDTTWIDKFQEESKFYDKFSIVPIDYVTIKFIYIDKTNTIKNVKNTKLKLSVNNKIKKEELYDLVLAHKKDYKLSAILQYDTNILKVKELDSIIENHIPIVLKNITFINDIELSQTLSFLRCINSLYVLYSEKNEDQKKTKKIFYSIKPKSKSTRRIRYHQN